MVNEPYKELTPEQRTKRGVFNFSLLIFFAFVLAAFFYPESNTPTPVAHRTSVPLERGEAGVADAAQRAIWLEEARAREKEAARLSRERTAAQTVTTTRLPTQQERDQGAIGYYNCLRNTRDRYAREQGVGWLDSGRAVITHCDNLFRNVPR